MALPDYRYIATSIAGTKLAFDAAAGATVLTVQSAVGFTAFSASPPTARGWYTIYDGGKTEVIYLSAVSTSTNQLTLSAGTLYAHDTNARIVHGQFNTVLAELPLINVQWSESLNEPGELSGQLLLTGVTSNNVGIAQMGTSSAFAQSVTPDNTVLWVERNGIVEWGGICVARHYDSESQMLSLSFKDFLWGLSRQRTPVGQPVVWAAGDDLYLFLTSLLQYAYAYDAFGLGVAIDQQQSVPIGPTLPEPYVVGPADNRDFLSVVTDLSQQVASTSGTQSGFDFYCSYGKVTQALPASSYYIANLVIAYPRQGFQTDVNNKIAPTLTFPGSMTRYTAAEDGANVANDLFGFGPGSTDGQYVKRSTDLSGSTDYPTAGLWPQLSDQMTLSQIPSPLVVDSLTTAQVQARKVPVVTMEIAWSSTQGTLAGVDNAPTVDDFGLGDEFRIIITDPFVGSFDRIMRLVKYTVSVGDNGQPETYNGTFVMKGTY